MKKKLMMVAVLLGALSLGACVDDNESASVTAVREAKAEQLQSIADLNKAEAEAKRQARNAIRTQQNRIEAGAKRKVSDAVRSKGNIKINGKSKKASI